MRAVEHKTVDELIELSKLLGEFGQIERAVLLPNGQPETDSHHSFALALITYELACQYAPELDSKKVLLYALTHDLTELVTGDVVTLTATQEELEAKAQNDAQAMAETERKLASAPHIIKALKQYEARSDDEALFVYWIDKIITIPTHFFDDGANLRRLGIRNQQDIQGWYQRVTDKLQKQSGQPHVSAVKMLELTYRRMHDELLQD